MSNSGTSNDPDVMSADARQEVLDASVALAEVSDKLDNLYTEHALPHWSAVVIDRIRGVTKRHSQRLAAIHYREEKHAALGG